MDVNGLGAGVGGGGLIGMVLTYLGIREKFSDNDKKHDEIARTFERVVFKDTCKACNKGLHDKLDLVSNKLDHVIERIDRGQ